MFPVHTSQCIITTGDNFLRNGLFFSVDTYGVEHQMSRVGRSTDVAEAYGQRRALSTVKALDNVLNVCSIRVIVYSTVGRGSKRPPRSGRREKCSGQPTGQLNC